MFPADRKHLIHRIPGLQTVLMCRNELESRWFDYRHRIHTTGDLQPGEMKVSSTNLVHGRKYNATNLRSARQVFRDLPVQDFSRYTFIDFGSGKGRMLFLAAEYPFRRIIGVEYASDLHAIAEDNIRRYHNPRRRCAELTSLNIDAAEFGFPPENSVLYFFSPFNRPIMEPLIQRLDDSVSAFPRDVVIVYLNPELSDIIENTRHFRILSRGSYYNIYQTEI